MNNLEQPIATGRTAEIYPYGEGKVLKLFFSSTPQAWIDKEVAVGRYIQATPLPVPKVFENVNIEGREGVVYERIAGPSLLNELGTKPWNAARYARLMAEMHVQVHEVEAPENLETQRDWARGGIPETRKISKDQQTRVLQRLDSLPAGSQLCHGDFHPGNIVVTQRGPVIIDWMTASRGVAGGDVARTATILEAAQAPEGTPMRWLLEWIRKLFLGTYLKTYFQLKPAVEESLADVSMPEEAAGLLAIVERGLRSTTAG